MAGILGNPLGYKKVLQLADLDTTFTAGYYGLNATISETIYGEIYAYGTMLVLKTPSYITQFGICLDFIIYRRYVIETKVWNEWHKI